MVWIFCAVDSILMTGAQRLKPLTLSSPLGHMLIQNDCRNRPSGSLHPTKIGSKDSGYTYSMLVIGWVEGRQS